MLGPNWARVGRAALLLGLVRTARTLKEPAAESFAALQKNFALDAWDFSVEFPGKYPINNEPLMLPVAPGGYAPWRAAGATDAFLGVFPSTIVDPAAADVVTLVRAGLHKFLEDGLLLIGDSTTRFMYDVLCMELVREVAGDMTDATQSETLQGINHRGWQTEPTETTATQCIWTGGDAGNVTWPLWFKAVVNVNGTSSAVERSGTDLGDDARRVYVGLPALHSLYRSGVSSGERDTVCNWGSLDSFQASVEELARSIDRRQRAGRQPTQIVASSGECVCLNRNHNLRRAAIEYRKLVAKHGAGEGFKNCRGDAYTSWLFDEEGMQNFNSLALGFMDTYAEDVPVLDFYSLLEGDRMCPFTKDGIHGYAPILLTEIALVWAAFFHLDAAKIVG